MRLPLRRFLFAGLALALMAFAPPAPQWWEPGAPHWTPDAVLIAKIEARFLMPRGAPPLSGYARQYAGVVDHRRKIVLGLLARSEHPSVQVVPADKLRVVMDGGCNFIDVRYDVAADKLEPLSCHGYA